MHLDVLDLKTFYYRSQLGRAAQTSVRSKLIQMWPEAERQSVVGFGFAVPLLRPYLADARRVIGLMPGPQGVMAWPAGRPNVSVLCDETAWPLDTGVADKLVIMHGLETSERPSDLLQEAHRVLGPGGRMILVVPNRAGLWSRRDRTPFGYGRPYTLSQLEAQVKQHGFVPERHLTTLYQPPSAKRVWRKTAPLFERIGSQMPVGIPGGVFMLEVSKQVYAPRGTAKKDKVKSRLNALDGIARPVPKPV